MTQEFENKKIKALEHKIRITEKAKLEQKENKENISAEEIECNIEEFNNIIDKISKELIILILERLKVEAEQEYKKEKEEEEEEKLKLEYRPPEHDLIPRPKKKGK
ncbi:hypothetical protein ABN339_20060 [Providencia stuartii]|uniref:hypothetical protein n=1 Tax=Providencia stuartii TaxID=588 RepID=UPI0032DBE553